MLKLFRETKVSMINWMHGCKKHMKYTALKIEYNTHQLV